MLGCCIVLVFCLCTSSILTDSTVPDHQESKENVTGNQKNVSQTKLLAFTQLAHGLRSGPITVLDERTIFIEDLHYDGKGPDAHFWVGNGSWPSDNGTLVPDENGSKETLNSYNGQNVTIKLPSNLTVNHIDYLAVWCIKYKHNFGHTFFRKKAPDGHSFGAHLEPFKQLSHGVRSGPITAVDKKTLFVSNFYFDGENGDTHFWVGKGTEPSDTGVLVFDENGSGKPLSKYNGQNIYITLPHNVTTDNIDYFGVWSKQQTQSFGHTTILTDTNIPAVNGNPFYTSDNKEIIRVKKCCAVDHIIEQTGCSASVRKFNLTINVRERTDSYALKNIKFVPFVQPIRCEQKLYSLDPKEGNSLLLRNGSLAVLNPAKLYSMDEYCFETYKDDEDRWVTSAFLCVNASNASLPSSAFVLYAVGT